MCLCEGTGRVILEDRGVIQWNNCPDSNCNFDKEEAQNKWDQFKLDIRSWEKQEKEGAF